jgi:5-methyltetrahydrofolate--homocysteine methyltransferase
MLRTVQDAVDTPICIDSSVVEALEAGLSVYEGRALVNSVTAEDDRLEAILPLVARHDAAVIGLANDETGIPETPEKRLECARKIVAVAQDHGIAAHDVIIDPLAMTVGADTEAVTTTLRTISLIRDELGVNMCLGASNVSFGLPRRHALNAGFLPMAMAAGLTSAIMSTAEIVVSSVRASDLLLGHDPWGANWIAAHRARQAAQAAEAKAAEATAQEATAQEATAQEATAQEATAPA